MPSITLWTRLEPHTRAEDIDPGLQARIYDPLWMLARQWQTGEFAGEDNGSPASVRLRAERAPLGRYFAGPVPLSGSVPGVPYRAETIPLETMVESESLQDLNDPRRDLRIAAQAGLYFLSLLERNGSGNLRTAFVEAPDFALQLPEIKPDDLPDREGLGFLMIMAGRAPDGFRLYSALKASSLPAGLDVPDAVAQAYIAWFERRYPQPEQDGSVWVSERMEYAFAVGATLSDPVSGGEVALTAPEYHGGSLDWYSFNMNRRLRLGVQPEDPQPEAIVRTIMPAPVRYPGMASNRWWEFEDAQVNLSRIEGDPDELMRLLLVHFALVYSNDWYVAPFEISPGALFRMQSVVVTDTFGERTLVPHYRNLDHPRSDWRLFSPTLTFPPQGGSRPFDDLLFLPPVLATSLHGEPIEEVVFLRDELANLVWAVERLVPGVAGNPLNRYEIYREREAQDPPPSPPAAEGELRYRLASEVPDYWIPFLPQRIAPPQPDIRLVRGKALRSESGEPAFSEPFGKILEPGREDLHLFEEEVGRAGLQLRRQYQYARWQDGATYLWLARRKGRGFGERSAGLVFDRVEE